MQEENDQVSKVALPEKHEEGHGKTSFWHVDRDMIPYKIHFFLISAGAGAVWPYWSVFGIVKLGLTASNIAAAYTAQQIFLIFIKPCIGYVADYFNSLKGTFVGLTLLQTLFCFLMISIPNTDMPGIAGDLLSRSSQPDECRFCSEHEDFITTVSQNSLDELNFERILTCFNDTEEEYGALTCSREYTNFTPSINVFHEIIYRPCNSSDKFFASSTNRVTNPGAHAHTALFILLSSNASQNSIICSLQEQILNADKKLLVHSCQSVSRSQNVVLQNAINMLSFKTSKCSTVNMETLVKEKPTTSFSVANFETYQFWMYSICLVMSSTSLSCMYTISDTAVYESIPSVNFGQQRVWGAVSYGFMAFLAGFLNVYTKNFLAAWCVMVLMYCLTIWNLSRMNLVKPDFSQNILRDLKTIFSSIEFLIFEAGVFMNGIFDSVIMFFLPWFLASIGGNELVIGLANTVQCALGEVPFLFISSWLITKLGHFNLLSSALVCYGIRFFAYSYLKDPWWILPIEITQGITYGSFLSAMTSYGKLNAKPGTEATTQSILSTTYEGPSAALGCLIFGICFDYYGGHATFYYASFVCGFTALISVFSTILIQSRKGELHTIKTASACVKHY